MRRRLTQTILTVTALTLVLLGVPLAVVVQRYYFNTSTIELQRRATQALVEITLPIDQNELDRLAGEPDAAQFSVYDPQGQLVFGNGPQQADRTVLAALSGDAMSDHGGEAQVVAVPLTQPGNETVLGVVRVTENDAVVDERVHRAWLVMAIAAAAALSIAWAVAAALARRLARPIQELAESAEQLGDGGVVLRHDPTGIHELDLLGDTLAASSSRLAELLARERAFSADVSHQLRTPLTGLRLRLEATVDEAQSADATRAALAEVDRLQATIEHLLALSRDRQPVGSSLTLPDVALAAEARWAPRLHAAARDLHLTIGERVPLVNGSRTALDQIVDVLIENAVEHGAGTITMTVRSTPGGAALDVADDGPGVAADEAAAIFRRHHGVGNGIGLSLARSLAEAEGARIILSEFRPPRFSIVMAAADSFSAGTQLS